MVTVPARLIGQAGITIVSQQPHCLILQKKLTESRYDQASYLSRHAVSRVLTGQQLIISEYDHRQRVDPGNYTLLRRGLYTVTDLVTAPSGCFEAILYYFDDPDRLPAFADFDIGAAVRDHPSYPDLLAAPRRRDPLEFLERHYDKDFTLADYAYLTGSSVSTFQRQFRRRTGQSPRRWIIARRMQRARELAARGYGSQQLAAAVGYANVSHFIRQFRLTFGYTPGEM